MNVGHPQTLPSAAGNGELIVPAAIGRGAGEALRGVCVIGRLQLDYPGAGLAGQCAGIAAAEITDRAAIGGKRRDRPYPARCRGGEVRRTAGRVQNAAACEVGTENAAETEALKVLANAGACYVGAIERRVSVSTRRERVARGRCQRRVRDHRSCCP